MNAEVGHIPDTSAFSRNGAVIVEELQLKRARIAQHNTTNMMITIRICTIIPTRSTVKALKGRDSVQKRTVEAGGA